MDSITLYKRCRTTTLRRILHLVRVDIRLRLNQDYTKYKWFLRLNMGWLYTRSKMNLLLK